MNNTPYLNTGIEPIEIYGAKFYSAKSIESFLGISHNATKLVKNLCQSDWVYAKSQTGKKGPPSVFISERGMYKLFIKHSDKHQLEFFSNWLCGHVLPELSEKGVYRIQ